MGLHTGTHQMAIKQTIDVKRWAIAGIASRVLQYSATGAVMM